MAISVVYFACMFQSHAGSIEAFPDGGSLRQKLRFNPTLVRLRPGAAMILSLAMSWFQSHAGSIEADLPVLRTTIRERFQSHAGSIEAQTRLEPRKPQPDRFQSHAGSIEARRPGPPDPSRGRFNPTLVRLRLKRTALRRVLEWLGFNPTLVRLRQRWRGSFRRFRGLVSIPRWFD